MLMSLFKVENPAGFCNSQGINLMKTQAGFRNILGEKRKFFADARPEMVCEDSEFRRAVYVSCIIGRY